MNGQIFSNLNGSACENEKETMPNGVDKEKNDDEKNVVLTNEQLILLDDQRQELSDLRRQVVFLQVSIIIKSQAMIFLSLFLLLLLAKCLMKFQKKNYFLNCKKTNINIKKKKKALNAISFLIASSCEMKKL